MTWNQVLSVPPTEFFLNCFLNTFSRRMQASASYMTVHRSSIFYHWTPAIGGLDCPGLQMEKQLERRFNTGFQSVVKISHASSQGWAEVWSCFTAEQTNTPTSHSAATRPSEPLRRKQQRAADRPDSEKIKLWVSRGPWRVHAVIDTWGELAGSRQVRAAFKIEPRADWLVSQCRQQTRFLSVATILT